MALVHDYSQVSQATARRIEAQNRRYRASIRAQIRALTAEARALLDGDDPNAAAKIQGIEDQCRLLAERIGLEWEYPRQEESTR